MKSGIQPWGVCSIGKLKVVSKFSICLLPGVFFSTQMAAVCMVATRILCVCTAGSQSAVLMGLGELGKSS